MTAAGGPAAASCTCPPPSPELPPEGASVKRTAVDGLAGSSCLQVGATPFPPPPPLLVLPPPPLSLTMLLIGIRCCSSITHAFMYLSRNDPRIICSA